MKPKAKQSKQFGALLGTYPDKSGKLLKVYQKGNQISFVKDGQADTIGVDKIGDLLALLDEMIGEC